MKTKQYLQTMAIIIFVLLSACDETATQDDDTSLFENDTSGTTDTDSALLDGSDSTISTDSDETGDTEDAKVDFDCPEGGAIVSLTYDDALGSQINNAIPALDAANLKATFFIGNPYSTASWEAAKESGHELGAHTFDHPCPGPQSWIPVGNSSQDYDMDRMTTELDENIAVLESLGQKPPFSFAFPCGTTWIGEDMESYVPAVSERFAAARGVVGGYMSTLDDPYDVSSFFLTGSGESLISNVDSAVSSDSWIVFGFHGVGGDHSAITTEDHQTLITYLSDNNITVLPFNHAAHCISLR